MKLTTSETTRHGQLRVKLANGTATSADIDAFAALERKMGKAEPRRRSKAKPTAKGQAKPKAATSSKKKTS